MHKHVGHPGTWQQFLRRSDITRIPIEEARQKYLKEQFYYDRWMATSQPALYGAGASAGSSAAFVGQAVDGAISGATVKVFNASNALVATTTTNSVGAFILDFVPTSMSFEVTGGTDTVTGVAFTGTLKAPAGSSVVSPITTAIKEVMDLGNTEAVATTAVFDMAREIYGIDIDSSVHERVKTENFVTLAETDANFLKVTGFASFLESSAEITGEQVNQQFSDETLQSGKEAFYKSFAGQADNYQTSLGPGSGVNWDSFGVGNTTGRSVRQNVVRLLGYSGRPGNLNAYNTIEPALQISLDRVREVVNDTDIDKNYGVTTVMTQNRIAKRDLKSEVTKYGGGVSMGQLNASASRFVQQNETAEAENLGTIFSGKTNRRAPESNKFAAALSYISGSTNFQLNFGDLTRGAEFNGAPRYTGVVQGESTLVWYDSSTRAWVIDNNLTLPALATADIRQSYPLKGQEFTTTDGRSIELKLSGSHTIADAPSGSGRYINSFLQPRGAAGAINFTSVSGPTSDGEGNKTWTIGIAAVHIGVLDLGQTQANRNGITLSGDYKITRNAGSVLYVMQLADEAENIAKININGAGGVALTRLSLGFEAPNGDSDIAAGGFNPRFMNNIGGIFET